MLILLIVAGSAALVISVRGTAGVAQRAAEQDYRRLATVKRLLLARALTDRNNPGALRNSDTDGDGLPNGTSPGSTVGRIPWRTLASDQLTGYGDDGIWLITQPEFTDNPGNRLNYAVNADFTLDGVDGYVGFVIVAGPPLDAGQAAARPDNDPAQIAAYLEGENADGDDDFTGQQGAANNDRVLGIRKDELLRMAEPEIGRALKSILDDYRRDCDVYPYPAAFDGNNTDWSALHSDPALIEGMLPLATDSQPETWGDCDADLNPGHPYIKDHWFRFALYAVAPGDDEKSGGSYIGCTPGADCLTVIDEIDGQTYQDVEALVILSGVALDGVSWGGGSYNQLRPSDDLQDYFEEENADGDSTYLRRPWSNTFNDRLYIVSRR